MCLENPAVRDMLKDLGMSGAVLACVVDEAHCISVWGGDFREAYSRLYELRALLPRSLGIPIAAFSATVTPSAYDDLKKTLRLEWENTYYLNLGNDRPNVKMVVVEIEGSDDFDSLDSIVKLNAVRDIEEIPKTIVFGNTRSKVLELWRHLRQSLNPALRSTVGFIHSLSTPLSKDRVMRGFMEGSIKILVATEAVGMVIPIFFAYLNAKDLTLPSMQGADIPDIQRVIQFGLPLSLSIWVQRAGRAGRQYDLQATAYLLVEKSAFEQQKKRAGKDKTQASGVGEIDDEFYVDILEEDKEFKKKVDPSLRWWLQSTDQLCRRDLLDKFFRNPPRKSDRRKF